MFSRHARKKIVPWSPDYNNYKRELITRILRDESLLARFRLGELLPTGYGIGIDERCVEYPWLLANLGQRSDVLLDAGSTLNHDYILNHRVLQGKLIHVLTLAPERSCFWKKGISYLFHDLRDIPIRNDYYDVIACISTLEHIGCDNRQYTRIDAYSEHRVKDFILTMKEFRRVLKSGGILYLTVPFGVRRHFGTFQQFDLNLLSRAIKAFGEAREVSKIFYRYKVEGWNVAEAMDCSKSEYVEWINRPRNQWPSPLPVEPDRAAAARAVGCVRLMK